MATTVTSDAEFKTYVEGLTAFTTDTVYMNDDSKYWTFTRENNGKINAMCVTSNNVELWMYDGTDWVINRVPSVVDNLTTNSAIAALSARQGKLLNESISYESETLTSSYIQNLSNANIILEKFGRICRLTIAAGSATSGGTGWMTVATLPEKYRPTRRSLGIMMDDSSLGPCEFVVETNGDARLWKATSGHGYWGALVYVV